MNKILRFALVIGILLGMLLAAVPAIAGDNKTLFTGSMTSYESGLDNPEFREWISDQYIVHWRNELLTYYMDASDDRLDGYYKMYNNGDGHSKPYAPFFIHIYTTGIIYAEPEFITPLWECTTTGRFDEWMNLTGEGMCHGVGENAGLVAKTITDYIVWEDPGYIALHGVIIEPGN